jgi:predicted dehydrogenase
MGADPARRWRFGLIGCGRMGRVHAERLRDTGRVEIAALYDPSVSAAKSLRATLTPAAAVVPSDHELIEHPDLDAVVICSPTHLHVPQVEQAISAGLHILCEKPLADTAAGLERLLRLAAQSPRQHVLAYQRRFWGTYRTLAREVRAGRWGAIRAVTSHNTERWQQTIGGTWRDDPATNPGGFLGDAGSHKLDALFYVTGLEPMEVFARSQTCGSRVEIVVSVSGLLSGNVPLTMDFVGSAEQQVEDLTIHCDEADLLIRDWRVWIAQGNGVRPLDPLEPTSDPAGGFVEILEGRLTNPAPFAVAKPVWDLTAMILESARWGQGVNR